MSYLQANLRIPYRINSTQLYASLKVLGINKDKGQCAQKTAAEGYKWDYLWENSEAIV